MNRHWIIITHDPENVYSNGEWVAKNDLIESYCDCVDEDTAEWIRGLETNEAVRYIANAWGLEYDITLEESLGDRLNQVIKDYEQMEGGVSAGILYDMLCEIRDNWDKITIKED